jgi:hypothetical protein
VNASCHVGFRRNWEQQAPLTTLEAAQPQGKPFSTNVVLPEGKRRDA